MLPMNDWVGPVDGGNDTMATDQAVVRDDSYALPPDSEGVVLEGVSCLSGRYQAIPDCDSITPICR